MRIQSAFFCEQLKGLRIAAVCDALAVDPGCAHQECLDPLPARQMLAFGPRFAFHHLEKESGDTRYGQVNGLRRHVLIPRLHRCAVVMVERPTTTAMRSSVISQPVTGLRAVQNLMPFRARQPCSLERRGREVDPDPREDLLHYRIGAFASASMLRLTRARVTPMYDPTAADAVNGKDAEPLGQTGERHVVRRAGIASYTGKTGYQCASPNRQGACCLSWPAR